MNQYEMLLGIVKPYPMANIKPHLIRRPTEKVETVEEEKEPEHEFRSLSIAEECERIRRLLLARGGLKKDAIAGIVGLTMDEATYRLGILAKEGKATYVSDGRKWVAHPIMNGELTPADRFNADCDHILLLVKVRKRCAIKAIVEETMFPLPRVSDCIKKLASGGYVVKTDKGVKLP